MNSDDPGGLCQRASQSISQKESQDGRQSGNSVWELVSESLRLSVSQRDTWMSVSRVNVGVSVADSQSVCQRVKIDAIHEVLGGNQ